MRAIIALLITVISLLMTVNVFADALQGGTSRYYFYYQDSAWHLGSPPACSSLLPKSDNNWGYDPAHVTFTFEFKECAPDNYLDQHNVLYSPTFYRTYCYDGNCMANGLISGGTVRSDFIECAADSEAKLDESKGTATCVVKQKQDCPKDQARAAEVLCGTFSCSSGVTKLSGGVIVCGDGNATFIPRAMPQHMNIDGCDVDVTTWGDPTINQSVGLNSEVGGKSMNAYCDVSGMTTGEKGSGNSETVQALFGQTTAPFLNGFVPAGAGGACDDPAHPLKGNYMGADVCYSNSNSNSNSNNSNSCPSNSTKDISGGCYCVTGFSKNSAGQCVADSNNNNNNNGGACGLNEYKVGGVCQCSDGFSKNSSGACAANALPSDGVCDSNTANDPDCSGGGSGGSKGSATTSGDCNKSPTCSGDPLVCASIQQTYMSNCALQKQLSDMSKTSDSDKSKSDSDIAGSKSDADKAQSDANTKANAAFSDFSSKINASSSGSCIQDLTLPVMGKSILVPFSQACTFFKILRLIVVASAYLAAARILFKTLG